MAIRTYQDENGKTLYEVSVSVKSKILPRIRKQKRRRGVEKKSRAQRLEKLLLKECFDEVAQLDGQGFHWSQIVEKWYSFKLKDEFEPIGKPTLDDYYSMLKNWTQNVWHKPAKQINRADVKYILRSLEDASKSKSFQSKMKGTINRVLNWGIEEGLVIGMLQLPTYGITVSRKAERKPTILNRDEITKLLTRAKVDNPKWYPIWAVAILTGCRSGELFALTWDDVDFTNMSLRISKSYNKRLNVTKSTKAGYWRNVPINSELKSILKTLKENSNSPYVLPRNRDWSQGYQAKALKNFCLSIGITPIRFHDLRACFATQLLQVKVSPGVVQKVCGWRDLDTMARYIRLAGIDEKGATDRLKLIHDNS